MGRFTLGSALRRGCLQPVKSSPSGEAMRSGRALGGIVVTVAIDRYCLGIDALDPNLR